MQHADRVAVYSVGDQRPDRNNRSALTGPGGGARSTEPGQINGVAPFGKFSHPHKGPSGPDGYRCHPHKPEPRLVWRHPAIAWRPLDTDCQRSSPAPVLISTHQGTPHPSHFPSTLCKSLAACSSRRSTQQFARCGFSTMAPSSLVTSRLVKPLRRAPGRSS